jgi:hypothetical protein
MLSAMTKFVGTMATWQPGFVEPCSKGSNEISLLLYIFGLQYLA